MWKRASKPDESCNRRSTPSSPEAVVEWFSFGRAARFHKSTYVVGLTPIAPLLLFLLVRLASLACPQLSKLQTIISPVSLQRGAQASNLGCLLLRALNIASNIASTAALLGEEERERREAIIVPLRSINILAGVSTTAALRLYPALRLLYYYQPFPTQERREPLFLSLGWTTHLDCIDRGHCSVNDGSTRQIGKPVQLITPVANTVSTSGPPARLNIAPGRLPNPPCPATVDECRISWW